MRLQAVDSPDSPHRRRTHIGFSRHQGPAPLRGGRRFFIQSLADDRGLLLLANRRGAATPLLFLENSIQAKRRKAAAPAPGPLASDTQFGADRFVVQSSCRQQDNRGTLRQPHRFTSAPAQPLQFLPCIGVQNNASRFPHEHLYARAAN